MLRLGQESAAVGASWVGRDRLLTQRGGQDRGPVTDEDDFHTVVRDWADRGGESFARRRAQTPEGFDVTFATNHLGPFALTGLVLDLLNRGEAAVSSRSAASLTNEPNST